MSNLVTTTAEIAHELQPEYIRAARALLGWSQGDLARAAGVALSTVADYERGSRTPIQNNAAAIRAALEAAGIRFLWLDNWLLAVAKAAP